jgi:hypothetical protein
MSAGQAGAQRDRREIGRDHARILQRLGEAAGMAFEIGPVDQAGARRDARAARRTGTLSPSRLERQVRSQSSAVAVTRGSMTTTFGAALGRFCWMRWKRTGWHQAVLEPTSTIRSAQSRSS